MRQTENPTKSRRSKVGFLVFSVVAISATVLACSEAPKSPQLPDTLVSPEMKPDRVAAVHVSMTAMSELSHLERALKPFLGITGSASTSASTASEYGCTETKSTDRAMWETTWKCGLDETVRGRKEVEGTERLNFDKKTQTLTYVARFETRHFDNFEPRQDAHTLLSTRKIQITFDASTGSELKRAKIQMTSAASLKDASLRRLGSNWRTTFAGTISRSGSTWTLDPKALIDFDGALYGLDGERLTAWASGKFNFVSEAGVELRGLSDSSCAKPIGTWRIRGAGAGLIFDTELVTSDNGGQEASGSSFAWPVDLCDTP